MSLPLALVLAPAARIVAASHLLDAYGAGHKAFTRGDVRVPAADPHLADLIGDRPVGTGAADLMTSWLHGWDRANLDHVPPPAPPAPQALALFAAPDLYGTPDLFDTLED